MMKLLFCPAGSVFFGAFPVRQPNQWTIFKRFNT